MFVNCMEHGMESLQDAYLYMVSPNTTIMSLTFIINFDGRYAWRVFLCLLIAWCMEWNHI